MNYYQARQRVSDLKWHYTCCRDNHTWPVGYCAEECDGHATAEEAEDHYRQWIIDHAKYDGGYYEKAKYKCEMVGCEEYSERYVILGHGDHMCLCDAHRNRETLEKIVPAPGTRISSW